MRTLMRNLKPFYYANVTGTTAMVDSDNNYTGEYTITYTTPVLVKGNISASMGSVYESPFGLTEGYDKVIVVDDPDLPIEESSVLWVNVATTNPYDYVVSRIARSLNSVSIAIKKVDVSGEDDNS